MWFGCLRNIYLDSLKIPSTSKLVIHVINEGMRSAIDHDIASSCNTVLYVIVALNGGLTKTVGKLRVDKVNPAFKGNVEHK